MRLIFTNKNGNFVKPTLSLLMSLLLTGISSLEGEEMATRRRLITPAFHLDKLKVLLIHILYNIINFLIKSNYNFIRSIILFFRKFKELLWPDRAVAKTAEPRWIIWSGCCNRISVSGRWCYCSNSFWKQLRRGKEDIWTAKRASNFAIGSLG